MAITTYDGSNSSALIDQLVGANSGIVVDQTSIVIHQSGQGAVNFYDGSQTSLGIGAGLASNLRHDARRREHDDLVRRGQQRRHGLLKRRRRHQRGRQHRLPDPVL